MKHGRRRQLAIALWTVAVTALCLVGYALYGAWDWYDTTHKPKPIATKQAVTTTTARPSEVVPKSCTSANAAAHEPRRIQIPSIKVDGCMQRVGIDQNHTIAAPTNVHVAGWYTESVLPGKAGVSLIDGHVQGRYGPAIFGKLHTITPNDIIRIENGDGSWHIFKVIDVRSFSTSETASHLFEKLPDTQEQLTLITCAGTYDKKTAAYNKRVLVRAALMHE